MLLIRLVGRATTTLQAVSGCAEMTDSIQPRLSVSVHHHYGLLSGSFIKLKPLQRPSSVPIYILLESTTLSTILIYCSDIKMSDKTEICFKKPLIGPELPGAWLCCAVATSPITAT